MKIKLLIALAALAAASASAAQSHGQRPHHGGEEAFNIVLSYVEDSAVADELTAQRETVVALREELKALRGSASDDELAALREELKAARMSLNDGIRSVVEGNDELRAELRDFAIDQRQDRIATGFALRNDDAFAQIVDASGDQSSALLANQTSIDTLRADIKAQRDAGASREELAPLAQELRALVREQRDIIDSVLDGNDELMDTVLADARMARQQIRERVRERRFNRRNNRG
ncbi:MAG: hypothetical protein AAF917_06495 [Pseudomonadota bacterium]